MVKKIGLLKWQKRKENQLKLNDYSNFVLLLKKL